MSDITIYYNPGCGTSRNTLAMIRNSGVEPNVVEYLKTPPSRDELKVLLLRMEMTVRDLLRQKGTPYDELNLGNPKWTDEQLLDFIGQHPILIQRPIVVTKLGVKLELVPVVSSNRMQFLDQGKIDLMIATMNDKPDRRKVVYIVEPSYYASMTNVLTLKSNKLKDWNELKGKKVCMIQGAWYNKKLQEDYGLDALAFKGTAEAFSALKSNNCVAFAYDDTFILASLLEPEWKDYEMPLKSILEDPWGLAVKLGEENFYKFMSEMVKDWHRSGRIVALEKKYGMANTGYALQMQAQFNKK